MRGFFSQVVMVIISIGIVYTYIIPTFNEVGDIQKQIEEYKVELDKVVSVNSKLSDLVSRKESVTTQDKQRLLRYLPNEVDDISVSRDLLIIIGKSGALYRGVSYSGAGDPIKKGGEQATKALLVTHGFSLSVEGTYTQIKDLLSLLERNDYPLEVQKVTLTKTEGGFLQASIELVTYAFQNDIISNGPAY